MNLTPVNVLVIFYSCCGVTEKLALAAAVGAVQARANIRLRRLTDPGGEVPECKEALDRMRKEYVPPRDADFIWADAVILGANGKIAGAVTDADGATSYGRRITNDIRTMKDSAQ